MNSPSIIPGFNVDVYFVLEDRGIRGRAYREIDEADADKATVIRRLTEGQYNNPVRIVAFNTSEGWSRDVTEEIAREIKDRSQRNREALSPGLKSWVDNQLDKAARSKQQAATSWSLKSLP